MKKLLALTCCCVDVFPEKGIINAGGNALNVAASCAKTGKAEAFLLGAIGCDIYAEKIKEAAAKHNINHEKLYIVPGETANNKIYLTEDGDRYFNEDSWTGGVFDEYRISSDDREFIKSFDSVATIFCDTNFKSIVDIRRASDFLLSVDFLDFTPTDDWLEFLPAIDLFFISGKEEHLPLYKKWSGEYPALFVATLGEQGSVAYKDGAEYVCPAAKVDTVVDTTGCGDSYQGAFIADYLENNDVLSAMKTGSEAAAITLSFVGAI